MMSALAMNFVGALRSCLREMHSSNRTVKSPGSSLAGHGANELGSWDRAWTCEIFCSSPSLAIKPSFFKGVCREFLRLEIPQPLQRLTTVRCAE
jgi:hypothetical protein